MPVKIERNTDQFTGLLASVKDDPEQVTAGIKARVSAAQADEHVVMMGGWTN
ncbi:hypothetical protein DWB77_02075 [Streptomyces hundungensis]|uniref:Uncharacterized protein n=1 Tax=Streptomyces hundungensis TaxID=1077946 RepID=A0A387H800_9ACTN|nr:hypothetical protein [Streptomyces hundungensis]AYG79956.1 hypothetical protein DWB77_02075 [Streptomyces hundungensis]